MRGPGGNRRGRRGGAALLALLALFLQSIMPLAHAAAMTAALRGADPSTIIICSAEGPKQVRLADDGTFVPVDQSGKLPPACPGCPVGASIAALPPPSQPSIAAAFASVVLPAPVAATASPASPRHPPSHPRAPPISV